MNIDATIHERELARIGKDWPKADALREALRQRGVIVRDTKKGQEAIILPPSVTPEQWEARERLDKAADANFDAWLFTMKSKVGQ